MPLSEDPTPQLGLPRPAADGSDDANVPHYVRELADRVEEVLLGADSGAGGWAVGDFKVSSRNDSHGRWLLCDGRELTRAQIEAELGLDAGEAADLATLWGTGTSSWYDPDDSTAAGKVRLPDVRGRAIGVLGQGPGLTDRSIRGQRVGEETHLLTGAESGIKTHSHHVTSLLHNLPHQAVYIDDSGPAYSLVSFMTSTVRKVNYAILSIFGDTDAKPAENAANAHNNLQPTTFLGNLFVRV